MTNLVKYVGTYQYENKVLTNNTGLKLMIANRGNVSSTKAPYFLLDKTTPKGSYVSSLYPLGTPDVYQFDYKGYAYKLKINEKEGIATINEFLHV